MYNITSLDDLSSTFFNFYKKSRREYRDHLPDGSILYPLWLFYCMSAEGAPQLFHGGHWGMFGQFHGKKERFTAAENFEAYCFSRTGGTHHPDKAVG